MNWYKTIIRENGKPHHVAIALLSEIVFWYRPVEIRDELSGEFLGWKKKFKDDQYLQKSYSDLAETFGFGYQEVQRAIKYLEDIGVIRRIVRNKEVAGNTLYNILYLDINPSVLEKLTYEEPEKCEPINDSDTNRNNTRQNTSKNDFKGQVEEVSGKPTENEKGCLQDAQEVSTYKSTPPIRRDRTLPTYKSIPPIRRDRTSYQPRWDPLSDVIGHIHRSQHRSHREPISSSSISKGHLEDISTPVDLKMTKNKTRKKEMNLDHDEGIRMPYRDIVRGQIEYETMCQNYPEEKVDEIVDVIVDALCTKKNSLRINGAPINCSIVRRRFGTLRSRHIENVLENMEKTTESIIHMRNYLLSALYNITLTLTFTEQGSVNHEMRHLLEINEVDDGIEFIQGYRSVMPRLYSESDQKGAI